MLVLHSWYKLKREPSFLLMKNYPWCKNEPWYTKKIYRNLHGHVFEYLFVTAYQDRYELMCGLNAYDKLHKTFSLSVSAGSGLPLPNDSTTDSLKYLGVIINFIYTWLKVLESNLAWICTAYQYKTKELFVYIFTTNPTPTPEVFKINVNLFWQVLEVNVM